MWDSVKGRLYGVFTPIFLHLQNYRNDNYILNLSNEHGDDYENEIYQVLDSLLYHFASEVLSDTENIEKREGSGKPHLPSSPLSSP